jgi:predicted transglutaminase-like cysteine proteinase
MKRFVAWGSAALAAFAFVVFISEAAAENPEAEQPFAEEFGRTLPPIGFVRFCAANPGECEAHSNRPRHTRLTKKTWKELTEINSFVNRKIHPVSDEELYGQAELWTYPVDAGDCEDFLLLKKKYLEGLGFPTESLLITVVLDEKDEGHAVLMVNTDLGDYVLDNRRDQILRWDETSYRFLKRQSRENARTWIALTQSTGNVSEAVSSDSLE